MEVYLNSIEMGDGIYGVQACAEKNFDVDAKNLTRSDCALIAATLPNPPKILIEIARTVYAEAFKANRSPDETHTCIPIKQVRKDYRLLQCKRIRKKR